MPKKIIIEKFESRIDDLMAEVDMYDTEVRKRVYEYINTWLEDVSARESDKSDRLAQCFNQELEDDWNRYAYNCEKE